MKTFCFPLLLSFITTTTMAQFSPALGPPQAGVASIPLNKVKFGFLTTLVKTGIDKAVVGINKEISNASSGAIKATLNYQISSVLPIYKQTENVLIPNQMIVQFVISVEYNISNIRYEGTTFLSRKLFQQIVISASCDGWQTNKGWSKFNYIPGKPYPDETAVDDPNLNYFIKNTLAEKIDSNLSAALGVSLVKGQLPIETVSCNCLNFKMGTAPTYSDGYVGFYYFPVRKIAVEQLYSDPVIRLLSVKRVASIGEILLDTQDLQIEYMANFDKGIMQPKPIAENETVAFKKEYSVKFEHPNPYNRLVVTVNVSVLNQQMRIYSGFLHFEKEQKFGEGVQKLTIMREVWRPTSTGPDGRPIKPYTSLMPAYELEFDIKYTKPKRY